MLGQPAKTYFSLSPRIFTFFIISIIVFRTVKISEYFAAKVRNFFFLITLSIDLAFSVQHF